MDNISSSLTSLWKLGRHSLQSLELIHGYGYGGVLLGMVVLGLSWCFLSVWHFYWYRPYSLRRSLLQQGFAVLPYRPFVGDYPTLKNLQALAELSDLPSPSHHNILPRISPFYLNCFNKLGVDKFVFWWGTQPTLVVGNPEDAKILQSADVKHFMKAESSINSFHGLFGQGLLLANGDVWHKQRNILRPAFFSDKLKEMVTDISTCALDMVRSWEDFIIKHGGHSAEVEVALDIKNTTADILARTSFGSSYEKGKDAFEKQTQLYHLLSKLRIKNTLIPGYRFLPTAANRECMKLEKILNDDLREIVEARRKSVSDGAAASYGSDLLGLMLAAEYSEPDRHGKTVRLTNEEVIDECKTFFFAGHETTANLLAWTMVLLAQSQEWQERAREEVLEICGKNGEPKADQLNKLKIMQMILNESLRFYPPVAEHGHRSSDPKQGSFKLGDKTLPPGTSFTIPCLYLHRSKEFWGEDADEFKPERFSNGVGKACKHPNAFMPFGIGPRTCIGQTLAIMEAKVMMACILQRFKFDISPNYKHAPVASITMAPQHGVHVILHLL